MGNCEQIEVYRAGIASRVTFHVIQGEDGNKMVCMTVIRFPHYPDSPTEECHSEGIMLAPDQAARIFPEHAEALLGKGVCGLARSIKPIKV